MILGNEYCWPWDVYRRSLMNKLVLAPLALAVLAACATPDRVTPASAPVAVAPPPPPAGVTPAPGPAAVVPPPAAGGTAVGVPPAPPPPPARLRSLDSITPVPT